jgi:hypothetical protein
MDPLTLGLIGGGALLGGLKTILGAKAAKKAALHQARQIELSPYTGRTSFREVPEVDAVGNLFSGGLTGAGLGQNIASASAYNKFLDSLSHKNIFGGGNASSGPYGSYEDASNFFGAKNPFRE